MRFRVLAGVLLAASVGLCSAADPPKYPNWPVGPVVPQPMPKPAGDVATFGKGVLYVVQGEGNDQLLSSPPGVVKITELAGPASVFGKFVDGPDQNEFRTYDKKQVFIVERVLAGQVELLKVPKGVVERRILGDGTDPIPPPKPPDPKPPEPKPPEPAKSFRVYFVYESAGGKVNATPEQSGVIFGNVVENFLNKNCTDGASGWRRRDKDSPAGTGIMGELWTAAKPKFTTYPCVVVEKNGFVEIIPVGATPEAMVATFNEYLTGKK